MDAEWRVSPDGCTGTGVMATPLTCTLTGPISTQVACCGASSDTVVVPVAEGAGVSLQVSYASSPPSIIEDVIVGAVSSTYPVCPRVKHQPHVPRSGP
jgi:hypothetical protein